MRSLEEIEKDLHDLQAEHAEWFQQHADDPDVWEVVPPENVEVSPELGSVISTRWSKTENKMLQEAARAQGFHQITAFIKTKVLQSATYDPPTTQNQAVPVWSYN